MNIDAIDYFKLGDRLGANWSKPEIMLRKVSVDSIKESQDKFPNGTYISDLINCWLDFVEEYDYTSTENLLVDWCDYHEHNCRRNSYGRTWRDHLTSIRFLKQGNALMLSNILSASRKRNSSDNGCLTLVYPVHCYAREIGVDPAELVKQVVLLTHSHPCAVKASSWLQRIIARHEERRDIRSLGLEDESIERVFWPDIYSLLDEKFIEKYPNNIRADFALYYAIRCNLGIYQQHVAQNAVGFAGDVSAVLSLAMMLYELDHNPEVFTKVKDIFPEAPVEWLEWPALIGVSFCLHEHYGGVSWCDFDRYRANTMRAAIQQLFRADSDCPLVYTLYTVGIIPAFEWSVSWPFRRKCGDGRFRHREKVQGEAPWDWEDDTSLIQIGHEFTEYGFDYGYQLVTGGRNKEDAEAMWDQCVKPLRKIYTEMKRE